MPIQAYGLVTLFALVSLATGLAAAWLVDPRRWSAAVVPTIAAFGALYLIGHRLGLVAGPQVELFGFQVSLVLDLAVALGVALGVALVQRVVVTAVGRGRDRARA